MRDGEKEGPEQREEYPIALQYRQHVIRGRYCKVT
jgi:hypothetical protein